MSSKRAFRPLNVLAAAVVALAWAGSVRADTDLTVDIGWGGVVREGRWAPIFIHAADSRTREAVLRVRAPQGGLYSMEVTQYFTLGPTKTTLPLVIPIRTNNMEGLSVRISDAATDRTLANFPSDPDSTTGVTSVDGSTKLVGVSGIQTTLQRLTSDLATKANNVVATHLNPDLLPTAAVGYDSLDLLVLNAPDLLHLSPDQQKAMIDWVRTGGNVVMWPGTDPAPGRARLLTRCPAGSKGSATLSYSRRPRVGWGLERRSPGCPAAG